MTFRFTCPCLCVCARRATQHALMRAHTSDYTVKAACCCICHCYLRCHCSCRSATAPSPTAIAMLMLCRLLPLPRPPPYSVRPPKPAEGTPAWSTLILSRACCWLQRPPRVGQCRTRLRCANGWLAWLALSCYWLASTGCGCKAAGWILMYIPHP